MKSYLRSAALLIICLSTANPVLAQCPTGKSEIVIITPSGMSNTICVADEAIPGLENAADHANVTIAPTECPCMDVWDGPPYPDNTGVIGTPPAIPQDMTSYTCWTTLHSDDRYAIEALKNDLNAEPSTLTRFTAAIRTHATTEWDRCGAHLLVRYAPGPWEKNDAILFAPGGELFTDAIYDPPALVASPLMDACKLRFEERGCVFQ